ncbi:MAG: hypothetical protein IKE76_04800, partial [Clostridia bacterium]|nr:hypothetical protein [Clostridia bacterium]
MHSLLVYNVPVYKSGFDIIIGNNQGIILENGKSCRRFCRDSFGIGASILIAKHNHIVKSYIIVLWAFLRDVSPAPSDHVLLVELVAAVGAE